MKRENLPLIIIIAIAVIAICCLCTLIVIGVSSFLTLARSTNFETEYQSDFLPPFAEPAPTPVIVRPEGEPQAEPEARSNTLEVLENTIVPESDPRALAMRLAGKGEIPLTLPSPPRQLGDQDTFWALNNTTDEHFQVSATLHYITDHVYFWVQDEVNFREREVADLAETFEAEIYPTNRAFFGSEWSPGVDEDPHLYILLAKDLGDGVAGYFIPSDGLHPLAQEYSNAHEMFMMNADTVDLADEFTFGVLAHEFQHMIHFNLDRNEESWVNEGFSELAMLLNGYSVGGADLLYASNPDIQLTDWPVDFEDTSPHYGASFLFTTYVLDRFGSELTQALAAHPANGLVSLDLVLEERGVNDPLTGQPVRADDLYMDWVLANYLQDRSVADGRFTYNNYPLAPQPLATEGFSKCPADWNTRDVRQYGVDYIQITCKGQQTLIFEGSTAVNVIPADPYSGEYAFWSNKGDESDMTLTQAFDFRDQTGPLTLSYRTWFDIEENWDYVYLVASTDEGKTWEMVLTPSGTAEDPIGSNYGWGYTGLSGTGNGWIEEEVDLSSFAGQEVLLRFEYVTDAGVNGEGLLLDDVRIPEIGYFSDFETDDGGWEAAGFVRIQNQLPQTYRLALISMGDSTQVEYLTLEVDNRAEIPLTFGDGVDEVVLVVTATTRFTRIPAAYRFSIGSP